MAGDWIKVEKATARKPEVLAIAGALGIHPDHAFGLCIRFWSWCDDHFRDGNAAGVTEVTLDALFDRSGFAKALISVGWLQARNGSLVIPHFDRHLSQTAKQRSLTSQRVAAHKQRKGNGPLTLDALPREEKSESKRRGKREETPLPPSGPGLVFDPRMLPIPSALAGERFAKEWRRWLEYRARHGFYDQDSATQQLAKMAEWGSERAIAAIDHTIFKGWKGIEEPKDGKNGNSNRQGYNPNAPLGAV